MLPPPFGAVSPNSHEPTSLASFSSRLTPLALRHIRRCSRLRQRSRKSVAVRLLRTYGRLRATIVRGGLGADVPGALELGDCGSASCRGAVRADDLRPA